MVSIAKGERIRAERLSESKIRAAETRKRRSEAAAAAGAAEACPKEGADRIEHALAYDIIILVIVNIIYDIRDMI
jgi:hypothetical protein